MKSTNLSRKFAWMFILIGVTILLFSSQSFAGECKLINIQSGSSGSGTKVELFPEKLTIPVGTCTVWINWVAKGEVKVSFRENAKACILSTASPTGFEEKMLKPGESCFVTEILPLGKTASLVWKEPGVYKYTIEFSIPEEKPYLGKGDSPYEVGTIVVE